MSTGKKRSAQAEATPTGIFSVDVKPPRDELIESYQRELQVQKRPRCDVGHAEQIEGLYKRIQESAALTKRWRRRCRRAERLVAALVKGALGPRPEV